MCIVNITYLHKRFAVSVSVYACYQYWEGHLPKGTKNEIHVENLRIDDVHALTTHWYRTAC